jgi:hypothetical protein
MRPFRFAPAGAGAPVLFSPGVAHEPIRTARIEGLSGPFARLGELGLLDG